MNKECSRKKTDIRPSRLSWEEKHPIDYLRGPSREDIIWLKKKIEEDEKATAME